ncbi:DUF3299 domain-containing protein [Nibricoccus aquaticus]|nr:DUF3299 domain-containing protein [Nibricoccus aquaticus]
MNFSKPLSIVRIATRGRFARMSRVVAGVVSVGGADGRAAIFKNGFVDHSICCASGGPLSMDGMVVRGSGGGGAGAFQPVSTGGTSEAGENNSASEAPAGPPKEVDGHVQLEFARLSDFKIEAPAYDPAVKPEEALAVVDKQIPEAIKRFDGKRAQITGFMLPVKMEGQLVSQFLLMRDQMMCCYGVVPRMNDWIVVHVAKPVKFTPDVPVSFRGKLSVKAMQEQGFITGIYLLEEAVPGPGK